MKKKDGAARTKEMAKRRTGGAGVREIAEEFDLPVVEVYEALKQELDPDTGRPQFHRHLIRNREIIGVSDAGMPPKEIGLEYSLGADRIRAIVRDWRDRV